MLVPRQRGQAKRIYFIRGEAMHKNKIKKAGSKGGKQARGIFPLAFGHFIQSLFHLVTVDAQTRIKQNILK